MNFANAARSRGSSKSDGRQTAGDRGPLLEAYLGLGDALSKSGALDKAIAVYGRVIEHDPNHARAAAALAK